MTAAFDERSERQKQAAMLRTMADQVASPVVAGRRSRRALSANQRWQWERITGVSVAMPLTTIVAELDSTDSNVQLIAKVWQTECKAVGIGAGLFGWLVWNWAFPLLLELAQRWIESQRNTQHD